PSDALLTIARIPSTLFLVLSSVAMFGIGWQFGGRLPAYFMSGLYTLNPIILLNGRRAMMEGSMLAFGLLTIWLAILISRGRTNWRWWVLFTLSAGLTLASKHTGVVFVGGAFGWITIDEIARFFDARTTSDGARKKATRHLSLSIMRLIISGVCTV